MCKRIFVALLASLLAISLAGCQFAMEEGEKAKQDRMIGVSIRVYDPGEPDGINENGDIYWEVDEEERAEENVRLQMDGDDIYIEYPDNYYEKEIGEYYCYIRKAEGENGEIYNHHEQNWPGWVKTNIVVNDDGETYELDSAVYVCGDRFGNYEEPSYVSLHIDSIYQREDGSIYAQQDRAGVSGMIDGFIQKTETTTTVKTPDGETQEWGFSFNVQYVRVPELVSAKIIAFDENHAVISETVLDPEQQPEYGGYQYDYAIPERAAYLVLEEEGTDIDGKTVVTRTISDIPPKPNHALFTYYVPVGDGFARQCLVFAQNADQ